MEREPHELCLAFPDMPPAAFDELCASIRKIGLTDPITLLEDRILDGRHRYRACIAVGVAPRFEIFPGSDPVEFVVAKNAKRRHLTPSQLAMSAARMKPYEERKARERMATNQGGADRRHPDEPSRTAEVLAKKAGVGARTLNRAIKVIEKGDPVLQAAVCSGEVALSMAEKIVELRPAAQRRIVQAAPKQRQAEMRSAHSRSDAATRRHAREASPQSTEPSTAFVRRLLSGLERLAIICAEAEARDGPAIADRFLREMDWTSQPLKLQLERGDPIFRALAIINQHRQVKAA